MQQHRNPRNEQTMPTRIAINKGMPSYPSAAQNPGFHPSQAYPEYPFKEIARSENTVYDQVRDLFRLLGFDSANYGTPHWNPLGHLVTPGNRVVIKPNFVRHYHRLGHTLDCVITHASVLRPIMDYVWIALQGRGELLVADAPQGDANFDQLIERNGTRSLFDYYTQHNTGTLLIELRDLRKEWTVYRHGGIIWERIKLKGDPLGYTTVPLDDDSEFITAVSKNYYGADPDRARTREFHSGHRNRYNVANTILTSDVFISVPKLKVHRKVGVTLNIKNLVGINGEKNFLPHFTVGSPEQGGDEFSKDTFNNKIDRKLKDFLLWKHHSWGKYCYVAWHALDKFILRRFQSEQNFVKGDWWGNDTTWRSAVDLCKVILYSDNDGVMQQTPQRRYFSIIDGILGGDAEGPLTPDPVESGVMIAGEDPLNVDIFATGVMGLDWHKTKMLTGAAALKKYRLSVSEPGEYEVIAGDGLDLSAPLFHFRPAAGWKDHLELAPATATSAT